MYDDHTVGVVIPAYNEAGFVGDVIETIPDYVDRIYPVDDCSTDGTWTEIREAAARIDGIDPAMSADGGTAPTDLADRAAASGASTNGTAPGSQAETEATGTDRIDRIEGGAGDAGTTTDAGVRTDAESVTEAGFSRRVVPIRHAENRGVGGAIKTGYQRARADEIEVTVVMGGDGQMDPGWMPDLLDPIVDGRAEYAKANRLLVDEHHETMPGHRFVGNHLLTGLTKIATGYWSVGDPQHGYTAISLEALETAGVDELYEFFGYCNDLLIRLSAENLRVADVPCPLTYADEESHIAYREYVPRVSGMLLRSFLRRLWVDRDATGGRSRLALFVGGAAATVGGVLGMAVSGIASRRSGGSTGDSEAPSAVEHGDDDDETAEPIGADSATPTPNEATGTTTENEADDGSDDEESSEREVAAPGVATDGGARDDVEGPAPEEPDGKSATTASKVESTADDGSSGACRYALLAVAGVAALLGAMLLDAVMNSTNNYTERVPEDAEPRVGEASEGAPAANRE